MLRMPSLHSFFTVMELRDDKKDKQSFGDQ